MGYIVTGERDGIKIKSADFGNSPVELGDQDFFGKTIVISTTNGTRAIELAGGSEVIAIGAFVNLQYLVHWLLELHKNIVIFCAGWKDTFSLEDSVFAGAVIENLIREQDRFALHDPALAALAIWKQVSNDPVSYLKNGSHYQRLLKLGAQGDLDFSLRINSIPVLPVMENNYFKNIYR
jgi:2-phosphosulfolactate phosphatase